MVAITTLIFRAELGGGKLIIGLAKIWAYLMLILSVKGKSNACILIELAKK